MSKLKILFKCVSYVSYTSELLVVYCEVNRYAGRRKMLLKIIVLGVSVGGGSSVN